MEAQAVFDLLDWKRRILDLYREIRSSNEPRVAWMRWRGVRDEMFRSHPQTPVSTDRRDGFGGLPFFDYEPAARVLAEVAPAEPERYDIATSGDGSYSFTRFAEARFELGGQALGLE